MGITYVMVGLFFLYLALTTNTKLDSLFFGFTGAGIVPGCVFIGKYLYWSSPKNQQRYAQKCEQEHIELHDELKEKIRGKSAQYTYAVGLVVISISSVIFYVLDSLNIIENGEIFVLFLTGYFVSQILIGRIAFQRLMKKY